MWLRERDLVWVMLVLFAQTRSSFADAGVLVVVYAHGGCAEVCPCVMHDDPRVDVGADGVSVVVCGRVAAFVFADGTEQLVLAQCCPDVAGELASELVGAGQHVRRA